MNRLQALKSELKSVRYRNEVGGFENSLTVSLDLRIVDLIVIYPGRALRPKRFGCWLIHIYTRLRPYRPHNVLSKPIWIQVERVQRSKSRVMRLLTLTVSQPPGHPLTKPKMKATIYVEDVQTRMWVPRIRRRYRQRASVLPRLNIVHSPPLILFLSLFQITGATKLELAVSVSGMIVVQ